MRRVYTAENAIEAQLLRDRLAHEGIAATVHGLMLVGGVGQLPADARPTVWIEDDALYDRARAIIAHFERRENGAEAWTCSVCGEPNGPAFETCWHCGAERTAPSPP